MTCRLKRYALEIPHFALLLFLLFFFFGGGGETGITNYNVLPINALIYNRSIVKQAVEGRGGGGGGGSLTLVSALVVQDS